MADGTDELDEPLNPIAIKINDEFKTKIRVAAARRNMSMSEWAREAFREKLARESEDD